jgi:hypothetical protein
MIAPMKRRLFHLLAAGSLVVAMATAVFWIRSYRVADQFCIDEYTGHEQLIQSNSGMLTFEANRHYELYPRMRPPLTFEHVRGRPTANVSPVISYPLNASQRAWNLGPISFVNVDYGPHPTPEQLENQRDRVAQLRKAIAQKREELAATQPTRQQAKDLYTREANVAAMQNVRAGWMWRLYVPAWLVFSLTFLLPAWWCMSFARRYRREKQGVCMVCGYDLRATPQRCPECGTEVKRPVRNPV